MRPVAICDDETYPEAFCQAGAKQRSAEREKSRCGVVSGVDRQSAKTPLNVAETLRVGASATLAFGVARLAGVSIDDALTGKYPPVGTCPHCGHHAGSKRGGLRSAGSARRGAHHGFGERGMGVGANERGEARRRFVDVGLGAFGLREQAQDGGRRPRVTQSGGPRRGIYLLEVCLPVRRKTVHAARQSEDRAHGRFIDPLPGVGQTEPAPSASVQDGASALGTSPPPRRCPAPRQRGSCISSGSAEAAALRKETSHGISGQCMTFAIDASDTAIDAAADSAPE